MLLVDQFVGQLFHNINQAVLCDLPPHLSFGFPFLFYPFFLFQSTWGQQAFLRPAGFVWWLPPGYLSGSWLPPFWWPLQWITATSLGSYTASRSFKISAWVLIPFPSAVRSPFSLYKAPWTCRVAKAYCESVQILTHRSWLSSSALINAHNSALCTDHA